MSKKTLINSISKLPKKRQSWEDAISNSLNSIANIQNEQTRTKAFIWLKETVSLFKRSPDNKQAKDFVFKRPGNFYIFNYNSKLYEDGKLEYYDGLPLIMVLSMDKKGFIGVNFHWMTLEGRIYILSKLMKVYAKKFVSDSYLLPMNYDVFMKIIGSKGKKFVKLAIRRYLWDHLLKLKGLRMLRIKNMDMSKAIFYTSPNWYGISSHQAKKLIIETSINP